MLCRVLDVSRAGYYAWRTRGPSRRQQDDAKLIGHIRAAHSASKGRYGAPRVHAELRHRGISCGRQRVARLMRQVGLRGKGRRKYRPTTTSAHAHPVADNRLARCFNIQTANCVWVGDITYLPTKEGWLYLAVLIDLFSRRVVGWAMSEHLTTALPLAALEMARQSRRPPPGLLHHSDRGSQYASGRYQRVLASMGALPSMSRIGNCWDNAVVESFFASLKRELLDGQVFESRQAARLLVFELRMARF